MLIIVNDRTDTVSMLGLDWGDVLFLSALLINESALTKNTIIRDRADKLLEAFEAAGESICSPTSGMGQIDD